MAVTLRGAVFDLDGTILDSSGIWRRIDEEFLGRRGFAVPPDYYNAIAPLGFAGAAEYTISRFHLREKPEDILAEWQEMSEDAFAHRIGLKPGVAAYLQLLAEKHIPCAVATASHRSLYEPALKNNGIFGYFSHFVTSAQVKRGKGFPDVYLAAAERIGVSPAQCAVFEDIVPGVVGARAGGFFTVAGADEAAHASEEQLRALSDLYIESFEQLLENDIFP